MLTRLVHFSLDNRFVILVLAAVLLGVGIYTAANSPVDVFPEFAPPQVTVETEAPGLSAEEVESLVTVRLELAINGAPGLKVLRSVSMPGVSSVTAIFQDGTDVYRDRQVVAERLTTVNRDLPDGVVPPEIVPLIAAASTIDVIGLTSAGTLDPIAARTFADWTLKPHILAVPGVAKVVTYGGRVAQYQVVVDPQALRDYDLSLEEIESAARDATAVGPAGVMDSGGQSLPIRSLAQARSPADLENAIVAYRDATPLLLSQVAGVRVGPAFPIGDATLNGAPAVIMLIARQPGVNTLSVTADLDAALDESARHLPSGLVLHRDLFRQASFIDLAVHNLRTALMIGAVLVAVVLVVFLLDFRTALISLTAIPLSLLAALLVLRALGASVNVMTLGGLAIALGEVVDDSIIDVENIHRRLRLNRQLASPRPAYQVIVDASLEVRSAVVYATVLVALVFLPVYFLSGVAGKIFSPLAEAYVFATLASLGVALLVTPAACATLLVRETSSPRESALVDFLKRRYAALLERSLGWPRLLAAGAGVLVLLAAATAPFLAGEFIPSFEERDFIVHLWGLPGTSLTESVAAGKKIEERLIKVAGVVSVAQRAGRGELADEVSGPESSEFDVGLSPQVSDVSAKIEEVRAALKDIPGFSSSVSQFLTERIEEVAGGEAAPVAVAIYGEDLDTLHRVGLALGEVMLAVPGARDVRVEPMTKIPQVVISFDRARVAQIGAKIANLQATVTTAFEGTQVGQVFKDGRIVPLVVRFPDSSRGDMQSIRDLPVRTASGTAPVRAVATVDVQDHPNQINRQNGSRRIVVTCDSAGSVTVFTRELQSRLRRLPLPTGYSVEISGDYESEQRSLRELLWIGLASMLGIFLLLFTDFRSGRLATLVLVNLPLAMVGGIGAAFLFRVTLSLGAIVGFVTLFGITARNSIMLISHYRHLIEQEAVPFGRDLVLRGSLDRLTPILMTALVTALALFPLVVGGAKAGQEIEHPMAVVIVGGLISSTVLNLLLIPSFFLRWGKPKMQTG